jgi:DNA-binding MurR/RpiR family transcriptional regulator
VGGASGNLASRVDLKRDGLTKTGRRVAQFLLAHPEDVAFGTVADVASRCGVGVASVHRLAVQLDYSGFAQMQEAVRGEMSKRLRPTAEKIRSGSSGDIVERVLSTEAQNIESTLRAVDRSSIAAMVKMLIDHKRRVLVASGESSSGVVSQFASEMSTLRPAVEMIRGNPVAAAAQVAGARRGDVMVVVDFHRYDAWLIDVVAQAKRTGLHVWVVSDSRLSPLATGAQHSFEVSAESVSPFDSHVGALVFLGLVVAMVAESTRTLATKRVDSVERAWREGALLRES